MLFIFFIRKFLQRSACITYAFLFVGVAFLFSTILWPIQAPADSVYPGGPSYQVGQVSQMGFQWWRGFSQQRRIYRTAAVHCLTIKHGASVCWSRLMDRMPVVSSPAGTTYHVCPAVRQDMNLYWNNLSLVVRYASAHGRLPGLHSALIAKVGVSLRRAEYGLQAMADTGECITNP